MKRRLVIAAALAFALGACASNDTAYRHGDGSYRGAYNDGYYAAAENGYGDYYYDRPQVVYDDGYVCNGSGYGFGSPGWGFGARFGYDPWFDGPCGYSAWSGSGYFGYPYYGYRPWPRHHHHDNDHDADDPPGGGLGSLVIHPFNASRNRVATHAGIAPQGRYAPQFERLPRAFGAERSERGEPVEHRSHSRDASHH